MSNRVRALSRCASSSLPWFLNSSSRSSSSCLIASTAACDPLLRHHEVLGRVDVQLLFELVDRFAAGRIDDRQLLDLVAPELDPVARTPRSDGHTSTQSPRTRNLPRANSMSFRSYWMSTSFASTSSRSTVMPAAQADHHRLVILRRAQAVDARHAGHDDHVAAADQRAGGRQPQPVDLLVDRGVLLDVDVALRNVRLGLVVVVVADEIVDRVVREELLELAVELGGQRLVVRQHERRPLHVPG